MLQSVYTIDGIHFEVAADPRTRGATLAVGVGMEIQLDAALTRAELISLTQALISVIKWHPPKPPTTDPPRDP